MHIHNSYLHRMTALYAIQVLTESLDVEMLGKVRSTVHGRLGAADLAGLSPPRGALTLVPSRRRQDACAWLVSGRVAARSLFASGLYPDVCFS